MTKDYDGAAIKKRENDRKNPLKYQVYLVPLSKALAYDLAFVAREAGIDPNEWIRSEVPDLIHAEKVRIIEAYEQAFVEGNLATEEFRRRTGVSVSRELLNDRKKRAERLAAQQYEDAQGFRNFMNEALSKTKHYAQHHDKHMKRVMREIERQHDQEKTNPTR